SLQTAAGALAYAVEPARPPESLRGRILDAARAERPNNLRVLDTYRRRAVRLAAVAAVAACAAVGLAVWNVSLHDRLGRAQEAPLGGADYQAVPACFAGTAVCAADRERTHGVLPFRAFLGFASGAGVERRHESDQASSRHHGHLGLRGRAGGFRLGPRDVDHA